MDGGTPLDRFVDTDERCKRWCSNNVNCAGVDFDYRELPPTFPRCFWFSTIDPARFLQGESCCTHFRTLDCSSECFKHDPYQDPGFFTITQRTNMSVVQTEKCEGACVVAVSFTDALIPQVERFCDERNPARGMGKNCEVIGIGNDTAVTCSCQGHLCNGVGFEVFGTCAAHYPLDCITTDYSGNGRMAQNFGVSFTTLDSPKNWSAIFNGQGHISVRSFMGYQWGMLRSDGVLMPRFTIALWVKREGLVPEDMTIVSNGVRGASPITIHSILMSPMNQMIRVVVIIGGSPVVVAQSAPMNQWLFVAVRVDQPLAAVVPHVDLFILPMSVTFFNAPRREVAIPGTIRPSPAPLMLGTQLLPVSNTNMDRLGYNFTGKIDEVWVFEGALNLEELQALRDSAMF